MKVSLNLNMDDLHLPQEKVDIVSGERVRISQDEKGLFRVTYYEPNQKDYYILFKNKIKAFESFLWYAETLGKEIAEILAIDEIRCNIYSQKSVTKRTQRNREKEKQMIEALHPSLFDFIPYN